MALSEGFPKFFSYGKENAKKVLSVARPYGHTSLARRTCLIIALAAAERFGEKFLPVGSTVSQRVHKDPLLLLLSALCTSLASRQGLIG